MVKKITALLMLLLLCLPMMLPSTEISALAAGASVAKASAQPAAPLPSVRSAPSPVTPKAGQPTWKIWLTATIQNWILT